jgi:hypothetical protein
MYEYGVLGMDPLWFSYEQAGDSLVLAEDDECGVHVLHYVNPEVSYRTGGSHVQMPQAQGCIFNLIGYYATSYT